MDVRSIVKLAILGVAVVLPILAPRPGETRGESAADLRKLADRCVATRRFGDSVPLYRKAAAIYRRLGDPNAAKVLESKASRYESRIELYLHRPARYSAVQKYYTGRRLEPVYGAYLGAFIDREDGLSRRFMDENSQIHRDSGEFNRITGRNHAIFFMYMSYGRRFPFRWTEHLRAHQAAAHIVLSPASLHQVQDDGYLRTFARAAARSGIPVFLRFAGEMNGDWVPYHGNPALYIEKFRLVARVMHEETANVAMVWCPNDVPEHKIKAYYPGPHAVDWVGVNFYSVLYNDNNRARPAEWKNPADSLKYVYDTYSARHPIMIGEYAATHLSRVDMKLRPDFAVSKIGQLYAALPRLYPRVKAVHWLSMNTLKYALPGRQLNNYSLLDHPVVAEQYSRLIQSRYFLEQVRPDDPAYADEEIVPLKPDSVLGGRVTLSAWARSYELNPAVIYSAGNRELSVSNAAGPHAWTFDTGDMPNGPITIHAAVRDSSGRAAARTSVRVQIQN